MATLSTTLSKAPANRYSYSGNYGVPKRENPYMRLGAGVGGGSSGPSQGLYAALMQQNQTPPRPMPSNQFQSNYNFDPILQRLNALGEQSVANARSEGAALRKQALIDVGDPVIAGEVGADPNTVEAARQNTMSARAGLTRDFSTRQRDLDENMNQSNLFYSGERVNRMGELERGRAEAEVDLARRLREMVSGIDRMLLQTEEAEQQRQIEAAIAAANRTSPAGISGVPGATGAPVVIPQTGSVEDVLNSGLVPTIGANPLIEGPSLIQPQLDPMTVPFPRRPVIDDSWMLLPALSRGMF